MGGAEQDAAALGKGILRVHLPRLFVGEKTSMAVTSLRVAVSRISIVTWGIGLAMMVASSKGAGATIVPGAAPAMDRVFATLTSGIHICRGGLRRFLASP